ncbi:MAG: hypothetical protein GY790_16440 [Bacteroidetes bacterium]|nr:hypothetical protein [Bacteroidota bacterium]
MLFAAGVAFLTPLHAQTEESSVKVMSYNIHRGGTMLGQPLSQTVKVIQEAKADVVGVQETRSPGGVNAEKLAQLLGWNYYKDHWSCILTRFEIVDRRDGGIKVKLPSGQEAYIFNLHLPSNPYQPYQLLGIQPKWHKHRDTPFIKTEAEAIAAAREARGSEISALFKQIDSLPDKDAPVFVVGDFNEPSHLDWTEKAARSGRHPIKVEYPNSKEFAKAGFADAWRTVYPDEMEKPGFTWSPLTKPDNPKDHHDRIDFVYFKGKGVKVTDAKIVGESQENANIVVSPYPSDHRAVVATFALPNQPNVSILVSTQLETDAGYHLALGELRTVLEEKGYRAITRYLDKGDPLPDGNKIIVGELGQEIEAGQFPFNKEAYRISQAKEPTANILKIEGDRRGGMYGLFKLAEQLQLGGNLWEINLELAPEFSMRMYTELGQLYDLPSVGYHLFEEPWVNHERFETEKEELKRLIDQVAKLGFNTFTLMHVNFEDYITYKYLDQEVYGSDDVHRIKAKHFTKHLKDIIDYAHERHIDVFMQVYEFQYPPKLGELYDLDLANPDMKTIIEAKVKELFEVVPLDGLVITATESLPRSGYKSVEPWRKHGKAGAGKMMTMYHNAGKKYDKKVIFRSWMIAYGAEDSDQVIANTPEDAEFEIKHTGDDFWLNFPLTDAIENGLGKKRPLTMTFDVHPQYYGWSRLICYQQRFAEETRIAKENGVKGIQAWGAWAPGCIWKDGHPGYLPNGQLKQHDKPFYDMAGPWNNFRIFSRGFTPGQMNAYLVARLTWDVNLTAEQIASDWGTIHFGQENAAAVSEVLMNSQAAFREIYLGEKREFSNHPTNFKWATTVNVSLRGLEKMYQKLPLSHILERNQVAREYLARMDDAFARIDVTKVPSQEEYQALKEGLEKTKLYLSMFFKFREMWWRGRELKGLGKEEATVKQVEYEKARASFNEVLEKWQKYPEECRFWGISNNSFQGGNHLWRKDVLRPK